jgi:hypothetical protein
MRLQRTCPAVHLSNRNHCRSVRAAPCRGVGVRCGGCPETTGVRSRPCPRPGRTVMSARLRQPRRIAQHRRRGPTRCFRSRHTNGRSVRRMAGWLVAGSGVRRGHRCPGVRAEPDGRGSVRCPRATELWPGVRTAVSAADTRSQTADTAADGCPVLQEAFAGQASAGLVPPPPVGPGELAIHAVTELGAHVGHGRSLQSQGLLGGQPAQPQA